MLGNDSYYSSKEFLRILREYEETEKTGNPVLLDADEYTDIAEYYHMKGDTERALGVATHAANIYPGATGPLVFMAREALLVQNNPEKAILLAEQIDDKTDFDYLYIMAEILVVDHQPAAANEYLLKHLDEIDDNDIDDYVLDVATLFVDYDLAGYAEQWLERSRIAPDDEWCVIKSRILICKHSYSEAEQMLNDLLDKNPYDNQLWNYLAGCQMASGKVPESLSSSEYSLAIQPDDSVALLAKANALFLLENYDDALSFYQRYAAQVKDYADALPYLAACCLFLKRRNDYLFYLEKACKEVPYETSIILGDMYPSDLPPRDYYTYEIKLNKKE